LYLFIVELIYVLGSVDVYIVEFEQ